MIRSTCMILLLVGLVMALAGCAGGPSYSQSAAKTPPLAGGQGRIYFYREGSMFGAAIQPHIMLNDVTVGSSKPGGFFYVDCPPGDYTVTCVTEGVQSLKISLAAGETRYVRTLISMGLGIGHITPQLEDSTDAMKILKDCHYTGQ
jgi:hypothetical protein